MANVAPSQVFEELVRIVQQSKRAEGDPAPTAGAKGEKGEKTADEKSGCCLIL